MLYLQYQDCCMISKNLMFLKKRISFYLLFSSSSLSFYPPPLFASSSFILHFLSHPPVFPLAPFFFIVVPYSRSAIFIAFSHILQSGARHADYFEFNQYPVFDFPWVIFFPLLLQEPSNHLLEPQVSVRCIHTKVA